MGVCQAFKLGDDGINTIVLGLFQDTFRVDVGVNNEVSSPEIVEDWFKILGAPVYAESPCTVLRAGHHVVLLAGKHPGQHATELLQQKCCPEITT